MKIRPTATIVVLLGIVLSGALLLRWLFPSTNSPERLERALNDYVDQGILFDFAKEAPPGAESFVPIGQIESAYYSNCIKLLREKYHQDIKFIGINEKVDPGRVNIYFIDKDPKGAFTQFRNNCTYTGYKNIIVCDVKYILKDLFHKESFSDFSRSDGYGVIPYAHIRTLVLWVIGHEIGHLAHRHNRGHFHFDGETSSKVIKYSPSGPDNDEKEADAFAVDAIGSFQVGHFLWLGLSQLAANPKLYAASEKSDGKLVFKRRSATHPPLFVRIIDNTIAAIERGYFIDSTGHFERIKERIEID
jgi:hypothetical protein